jgi:hypothetical protein
MQWYPAGSKPIGDLAHMLLSVGVIEVLSRSKNLDCLRSASRQSIQQAGMQPLLHVNIRRHRIQHQ